MWLKSTAAIAAGEVCSSAVRALLRLLLEDLAVEDARTEGAAGVHLLEEEGLVLHVFGLAQQQALTLHARHDSGTHLNGRAERALVAGERSGRFFEAVVVLLACSIQASAFVLAAEEVEGGVADVVAVAVVMTVIAVICHWYKHQSKWVEDACALLHRLRTTANLMEKWLLQLILLLFVTAAGVVVARAVFARADT